MQAGFTGLGQSAGKNGGGDTVELGVQLDSGHELRGTCDLEIHIAQGVLSTENIGEGCVAGFAVDLIRDKTHSDTGDGCAQGHTGVQQGEGGGTDGTHGGRTVGA